MLSGQMIRHKLTTGWMICINPPWGSQSVWGVSTYRLCNTRSKKGDGKKKAYVWTLKSNLTC